MFSHLYSLSRDNCLELRILTAINGYITDTLTENLLLLTLQQETQLTKLNLYLDSN